MTKNYLIKHEQELTLDPEKGFVIKKLPVVPGIGVAVTSMNNVSYVIGKNEELRRATRDKENRRLSKSLQNFLLKEERREQRENLERV